MSCGDPGSAKCAGTWTASATGVMALSESVSKPLVAGDRSEGLFGQSFSVAPTVEVLRRLPCLGSSSVVQWIRHIERGPLAGVLLCKSACQAHRGAPWVGSYSVFRHISHSKEHTEWGPTLLQCIRHLMGQPLCCFVLMLAFGERGLW